MQAVVERIQAKTERLEDRHSLLGLLCLGVVHSHVCSPHVGLDKKLVKLMLDLHYKVGRNTVVADNRRNANGKMFIFFERSTLST